MNIELRAVEQRYGETTALSDLNASVADSHCLALIGPSGGGKSTTLRLLAGLESPTAGEIIVNGQTLPREEKGLHDYRLTVGVVFQAYNLFPHLDALANIALPLEVARGYSKKDAHRRASELLERFQLADQGHKRPAELSGGQNQRVAIARLLVQEPGVMLADEPVSALDIRLSRDVIQMLVRIAREQCNTLIVSLHALDLLDEVLNLRRLLERVDPVHLPRGLFDFW